MANLTHLKPVSRLSPLVIRVLGCNPGVMTLQGTNTYVVGTGQRRILIDTGEKNKPEYMRLLSEVGKSEQIKGFEHVILTHWHHDHVGGLDSLPSAIADKNFVVWKFPRKELSNESPLQFQALSEGQQLKTTGATLRVIHTPGHTTDHVCLYLEEENILFSGDSVLGEGSSTFENLFDYMKSLEKILVLDMNRIFPGHGPVVEDPHKKISEYIKHRNLREQQIMNLLAQNECSLEPSQIVTQLYKDTPALLLPAAERNVLHHLEKLLKENKVEVEDRKWKQRT